MGHFERNRESTRAPIQDVPRRGFFAAFRMTSRRKHGFDWAAAAAGLAARLPRERLHPAVLAFANDRSPRTRWAVAFSGGPDSLALLLLVWAHWPNRRRTLAALHFDHRLRGAESRADAVFCRKVCAALDVRFITGAWSAAGRAAAAKLPGASRSAGRKARPAAATPRVGVSEAAARDARHAFFQQHARVLWLGHQQDDVAESLLMRIARGSGAGGLAAPRPVQRLPGGRVHLRPLLTLKKSEIVAALHSAGARWRADSSNAGDDFFRNRIRRDVLPAWNEAAQRDALAGAARARELLEEDDAALEAWLDALAPWTKANALALRALAGKPRALQRRALHRWLLRQPRAGALSRQAFEALLVAVERGRPTRHSLGREGFGVIRDGFLRFESIGKRGRSFQRRFN